MRRPISCAATLALALLLQLSASAAEVQDDAGTPCGPARIVITTDIDSARVYVDTLYAGLTPFTLDSLPPGVYRLRVLPPHAESWLSRTVDDTLTLRSGDTLSRCYTLREYLAVQSEPPGARVYLGDSLVGETPSLVPAGLLQGGQRLSIRKEGFEQFDAAAMDLRGSILRPLLKPGWQTPPPEDSPYLNGLPEWSGRRIGLYVSGGTSVLAGIAAAYLKIAADERQAFFLETRDPAVLDERKRLDTWAGITFALTQVGLAVFSYLLMSE